MLYDTLSLIRDRLDEYLTTKYDSTDPIVNLVDFSSLTIKNSNKIIFSLLSIKENQTFRNLEKTSDLTKNGKGKPDYIQHLDFEVIFAANFRGEDYSKGLSCLDDLMQFFNRNPVIVGPNKSRLNDMNIKAIIDIANYSLQDASLILPHFGIPNIPFIIYKLSSSILQKT